ncbi:DUF2585 family protein [Albidovulum sp.]|jgi:hypothetical protein|uniref:DUF2585 family protein n=1 Tax=Albidovulum sp. TaxID=1872424 RepID=UPI0039B911D0
MRLLSLAALLGSVAIGVTLRAWGQPLVSASGKISLWVNSVWSGENSQQIADWYTLSHVIHGMLIALAGRALGWRIGFPLALGVAIATGVGWEIGEHTTWVLERFRGQTIYQGYRGDTVLNAVCDYLFMLGGFALGASARVRTSLLLILGLEVASALVARDNLILTTIRVVHPVPAITAWQDAANPRSAPGP